MISEVTKANIKRYFLATLRYIGAVLMFYKSESLHIVQLTK